MNNADQKYVSEPWCKARICARLAKQLVTDPAVTSSLMSQAVAHLRARSLANGTW